MHNRIILDVSGTNKEEIISKMSELLLSEGIIQNKENFVKAALLRESEITTGFGNGVAIPHGKSETVLESSFIFAKLKNPIDWESIDQKPVDLVFLLAIEDKEGNEGHLRTLSRIAMAIMEDELIEALRNSKNKDEIVELLNKI